MSSKSISSNSKSKSSGSSSKRKSTALDTRTKFEEVNLELEQEKKIFGSAANPKSKSKNKDSLKSKKKERDESDSRLAKETDFGAESKSFVHKGDDTVKGKKSSTSSSPTKSPSKKAKVKAKVKEKLTTSELKVKAKKTKANLEEEMDKIDERAEEFADSTWVNTYHVMFRKLRKIMRATEKRVVDSEKSTDIYALMALYNQMREVIADLRSMIDLSQNTQRIIDQVLYPLTRDISNNYVDSIYKTMKSLRAQVDGEKFTELRSELEKFMSEHGKYIQSAYEKSSQRLSDLLED